MNCQSVITRVAYGDWDGEYFRHWSPDSELYAPADVLFQYLWLGWSLKNSVAVEVVHYGGYRRSVIYFFTLENEDKVVEIPVVATPPVLRLVEEEHLETLYVWTSPPSVSRKERRRYPWRHRAVLAYPTRKPEFAWQEREW